MPSIGPGLQSNRNQSAIHPNETGTKSAQKMPILIAIKLNCDVIAKPWRIASKGAQSPKKTGIAVKILKEITLQSNFLLTMAKSYHHPTNPDTIPNYHAIRLNCNGIAKLQKFAIWLIGLHQNCTDCMQIAATAFLKEGSTAIQSSFGHSGTNHAILVQFHHIFTILEQSAKSQSISEWNAQIEPNSLHFGAIHMQLVNHLVLSRYHNHTFLLHNPIGFKKSWHIPAIQAEEMVEGYKELEWDCMAKQNHNVIQNPHTILMQSRNPTPIGEHTAGEYRTRVYVGRGVPGAVRSPIAPEFQDPTISLTKGI